MTGPGVHGSRAWGKPLMCTPRSWCQKWLSSGKNVSGHVEFKKNGTVNLPETRQVVYLHAPPAFCMGPARNARSPAPLRGAKVRRALRALLTCVSEITPPGNPNSPMWTLFTGSVKIRDFDLTPAEGITGYIIREEYIALLWYYQ